MSDDFNAANRPAASMDPWDPWLTGKVVLEQLKNAEGGALTAQSAADQLTITVETLRQRAKQRYVFSWFDADGSDHYPQWQFKGGVILPGVAECLNALRGSDQWAVLRFFLSESTSAGDIAPLDLVRKGDVGRAVAIAQSQSIRAG